MCSKSFFIEMKCIVKECLVKEKNQRNSGETDRENIVPGILCIIWKLSEAWLLEKDSVTFSRLLKLLKRKKNTITAWRFLKFLILRKGLSNFLTTFTVINAKKDLITFLWILKILILKKGCMTLLPLLKFNIEKGHHHFLASFTVFNFRKWLHHILMTLKDFQNSFPVECWWTAGSEGLLSYYIFIKELDLLWVSNFISLGLCFLFGTKFSWNEGIEICFNVGC